MQQAINATVVWGTGNQMIYNQLKKVLSIALSLVLITVTSPVYGYQEQEGGNPNQESAPKSPEQLQALVAPIALYPDALVAQTLSAATFPDQVVEANQWLEKNKGLTGEKLAEAVNTQPWDPAVKAMTQFNTVLDNMAKNMAWTSELGEAYHIQPKDVMKAVQVLRKQAKAAGHLQTTSQMTVVEDSPGLIVIQPANPQIVYVPTYNPAVIYGTPYVDSRIHPGRSGRCRGDWFRSRHCSRRSDDQPLCLGMECLGSWLAWRNRRLRPHGLLRKRGMAWRLRRVRLPRLWHFISRSLWIRS